MPSSSQLKNNKKVKETFINLQPSNAYALFHSIASIFALYVSFRCSGGFDFVSFMWALCCPWLFLIYVAATKGLNFCAKNPFEGV